MTAHTTLAERLVLARTKRGLSQNALAELAGMAQQTVSKLELGTIDGTRRMATLAHILGVNAYWLESGIGSMEESGSLSHEERILLDAFREKTPLQRKGILAFLAPGKL